MTLASCLNELKSEVSKIQTVKDQKTKNTIELIITRLEDAINKESLSLQEKIIELQENIIESDRKYISNLEKFQNLENKATTKSYASIASGKYATPKIPVFPVIIKTKNENEDIKETILKNVKISKLGIGVSSIRKTSKNELIINLQKADDMANIKNEIAKLKLEGIHVENIDKKRPCMIFKGIDEKYTQEEFISDLILQNEDIKIIYEMDPNQIKYKGTIQIKKFKQKNIILETSGDIRNLLISKKSVNLGFYQIKVEDCNPLMQCYHCQKYGHTAMRCLQPPNKPICLHCAGEHNLKNCNNKNEIPKCINCTELNLKFNTTNPTDHKSNSEKCKHRLKMLNFAQEKINYNSK